MFRRSFAMALPAPAPVPAPSPSVHPVDPEFLAWARTNQRQKRLKAALSAQLLGHPDPFDSGDVAGQVRAWAKRQARARRLQASAMAHLRHG